MGKGIIFQSKSHKWPKKKKKKENQIKKCTISLAIKEMQIKTTYPVRMAVIKNISKKCW
jgi:transcriptional regulator of met regulon